LQLEARELRGSLSVVSLGTALHFWATARYELWEVGGAAHTASLPLTLPLILPTLHHAPGP